MSGVLLRGLAHLLMQRITDAERHGTHKVFHHGAIVRRRMTNRCKCPTVRWRAGCARKHTTGPCRQTQRITAESACAAQEPQWCSRQAAGGDPSDNLRSYASVKKPMPKVSRIFQSGLALDPYDRYVEELSDYVG